MSWYWIAALAAVVFVGLVSARRAIRLPAIAAGPFSSPPPPEIDDLLRAGQKIDAIKRYRTLNGVI